MAAPPRRRPAPTRRTCRPPPTPHAGRAVVVAAIDNLGKGAAGQAVQDANLMLGLPETAGLTAQRESRRERHRPAGFRAAGRRRRAEGLRRRDVAVVINDGPSRAAAGVFTANRVKAAPVLWTQQVLSRRPGARGRAQLRRRQRLHRPAGLRRHPRHRRARSAAAPGRLGAGEIAVCSTGLIGERLPHGPAARRRGRRGAAADASRGGGLAAADAIRTTDTVAKIASPAGATATRSAAWPRAPGMLAPGPGHHAVRAHHRRRPDAGRRWTPRCAAATPVTFDRLDTDGCMSTNDTVLLLASGASGVAPDAGRRSAAR